MNHRIFPSHRPAFRRSATGALLAIAVAGCSALAAAPSLAQPADDGRDGTTPQSNAHVAERVIVAPAADAARGMTVTFRAKRQGAEVEYRIAESGDAPLRVATTSKAVGIGAPPGVAHQSAALEGLDPATTYEYRIVAAAEDGGAGAGERQAGPWRSFATAPDAGQSSRFDMLFFGDAQNGLTEQWRTTAQSAFAAVPDAELILQSGDMINEAHLDREWGDWYEAMDGKPASTPLLTAIGNHEFTIDPFATAFNGHFTHPANGPEILRNSTYVVDRGGVRIVTLTANGLFLDEQRRFLDEALESNPHEWSIVMFHQPVHNAGTARDDRTYGNAFAETIERHGVDLVLNGHDHAYARGHKTAGVVDGVATGPVYMVATAGSKFYGTGEQNRSWTDQAAQRVVWAQHTSTFQKITVDACTMDVIAVITAEGAEPVTSNGASGPGSVLDSFTIDKCGPAKQVRTNE